MNCYICNASATLRQTTNDYEVIDCAACDRYKIAKLLISIMSGRKFDPDQMRKILNARRKKLTATQPEPFIETWDEDYLVK
ncbi:hypothetical protein C1886_03340 [Pseudomonas sp. FW300-N1A1]|uniref:hypothetical protein n=1 Tax=Pseudomonas sp. FW300-N1A1 TaxID=2075555 RepID=UPI000CD1F9B7|nr:hypothetical protein [Pseudomonas sp. FW300-N1A1]POA21889.1 hypothetical protein C1886_03340 [Pseudomonas sp. FW300-N1A1]